MAKHIEKRRRVYYAMLNIPAAVRPAFNNKRKLIKSLETESISQAQVRVLPIIADWKNQIEIAKGKSTGDKFLDAISMVRRDAQRLKNHGVSDWEIKLAQEEVAMGAALGPENTYHGGDGGHLYDAVSIAHGDRLLLSEHVEAYLSTTSVTLKTKEMIRRDLVRFVSKFRFADDATQRAVRDWANIDLDEAKLAVATRRRMLSACRGYWDYLERHKKLDVPPPFHKVLPPKPKKRTKAEIEAKRKAFRVVDYHNLLAGCQDDLILSDLITLAAYTGCRIEELCGLKLANVRTDRFELVDAKTEAGWRTMPIHDHIKQTVARLVDTSKDGYLLSGLTFNKFGDRSNAVGKRFGRLKKGLGYGPDHVFHSLRKGFATQLENAGQPLNVVARLMGHAQDNQSFGNYSDGLVFEELRIAINRVDWSLH
ncbi:MAG: tyrosine-type recombinase/integrase [Rhodobacterales bacterium]